MRAKSALSGVFPKKNATPILNRDKFNTGNKMADATAAKDFLRSRGGWSFDRNPPLILGAEQPETVPYNLVLRSGIIRMYKLPGMDALTEPVALDPSVILEKPREFRPRSMDAVVFSTVKTARIMLLCCSGAGGRAGHVGEGNAPGAFIHRRNLVLVISTGRQRPIRESWSPTLHRRLPRQSRNSKAIARPMTARAVVDQPERPQLRAGRAREEVRSSQPIAMEQLNKGLTVVCNADRRALDRDRHSITNIDR